MMISTKGRYALRVMVSLAQSGGEYVPLKEIAQNQGISLKYLSGIMSELSHANLVSALHGKGGGYKLCRAPEEYTLYEILSLTEDTLSVVACLQDGAPACERMNVCPTVAVWRELDGVVNGFLSKKTLADLVK